MSIPVDAKTADWPRKVSKEHSRHEKDIRNLQNATAYTVDTITFTPIAEPVSPVEGMTYQDSTSHKLRTYDGTIWRDHW